jgi:hypothetical protein
MVKGDIRIKINRCILEDGTEALFVNIGDCANEPRRAFKPYGKPIDARCSFGIVLLFHRHKGKYHGHGGCRWVSIRCTSTII